MTGKCDSYKERIASALAGELSREETHALESHLAQCPECSSEKEELEQALGMLSSLEEEEVPRHFFVYEEYSRPGAWTLFRSLSWGWKGAIAAAVLMVAVVGVAALSNLQVRFSKGSMTVAFGNLPVTEPELDAGQLRSDFTGIMEARLQERDRQWMEILNQKVSEAASTTETQGRERVEAASEEVRSFCIRELDRRVVAVETGLQASLLRAYQTLYSQHELDMLHMNDRLDLVSVANRLQGNQTRALTSTVLQFADLQNRQ